MAVVTLVGTTVPASASPGPRNYPEDTSAGYVFFDDLGEHFHMYDTKTNGKYIWITWGEVGTSPYHNVRNNTYYRDVDLDLPEGVLIEFWVCEGSGSEPDYSTCGPWKADFS